MSPPFVRPENFFFFLLTEDGRPYGPQRYKEIVKERYYISKYCNTSYNEAGETTPTERRYLLEFITDELQKQKEMIEKSKKKK